MAFRRKERIICQRTYGLRLKLGGSDKPSTDDGRGSKRKDKGEDMALDGKINQSSEYYLLAEAF
jgi:hypothetical protein